MYGSTILDMSVASSFRSAGDASAAASSMLNAGEPLPRVWRFCLVQMLDDYTSVVCHDGVAVAAAMWRDVPPPTGDARVDAGFAAMAEYLARRDGWTVPAWACDTRREAIPWFVTDLTGLHPRPLVESPLPFRRRGVFITRGALERV
jgi:hypothetical protein